MNLPGCDPALPGFPVGARDADSVLNSQHADFVDVIHSNKGNCGVFYSSAHYDIYAEDGYCQPGCDPHSSRYNSLHPINPSLFFVK